MNLASDNPRVEERPVVLGVNPDQYIEYFGVLPDGKTFVIFRPEEGWNYSDFRCFVNQVEVKVVSVERYRDGGTTIVNLLNEDKSLSTLYFPTSFKPELEPTFNNVPIKRYPRGEGRTI